MTDYPPKPAIQPIATTIMDLTEQINAYGLAWADRDAALLARIAELEADVPPPPKPEGCLFGSSQPEKLPAVQNVVPKIPVVRAYLGPGQRPASYTASGSLKTRVNAATHCLILSWKDVPGQWLDDLLGSLKPTGLTVYGCQNHEPYDNFWPGNVSEYHARWDVAEQIMAKHSHVVPATILEAFRIDQWDAFSRPNVPVWGMDAYNPGIGTPKAYKPPADVFAPYVKWARGHGKRMLIGETGTGLVAGSKESDRKAWAAEAHRVLEAEGVEVAAWWYADALMCPLDTFMAWLNG